MKLDKDQLSAVTTTEKNVLVSSGAGSGKTRVISERIRYMIKELGIDPSTIVAITYTNASAGEMSARLSDLDSSGMFIGTIHSYANKMLKSKGQYFNILSTEDIVSHHAKVASDITKLYKFNKSQVQGKDSSQLMSIIPNLIPGISKSILEVSDNYRSIITSVLECDNKTSLISGDKLRSYCSQYLPSTISSLGGSVLRLYGILIYARIYQDLLYNNKITFNQLLELASDDSGSSSGINLLVDEFQDIGSLEYEFIRSLSANSRFYVGDDWQAIYQFKGSSTEYFFKCIDDDSFKIYHLTNNYRCKSAIVQFAKLNSINRLYKSSCTRVLTKNVNVANKSSEGVAEIRSLTEQLADIKNHPNEYKDWFILARSNSNLDDLHKILNKFDIPTVSFKKSQLTKEEISASMKADAVKLLTIHTAKGLESPNVLLYLPNYYPLVNSRYDGDELRVLYVGITRAINKVVLVTEYD